MNIPDPATIEVRPENHDPVTGDHWLGPPQTLVVSRVRVGQDDSGDVGNEDADGVRFYVGFDDYGDVDARSGFWSSTPFDQGDGDDVVVNGEGNILIRPLDPRDAISLSEAKVPQPLAVLRAAASGNGEALATELDAVVAGDNTVATLMLDTGLGVYVRYSGDWQKLSPDSTALDDMHIVQVAPGAIDVWDAGESSRSTVHISDLPIAQPGDADVLPLPAPVDTGGRAGGGELLASGDEVVLLLAAGVMIPPINEVEDLDLGLRFASIHPAARWYVAKRARALGAEDRIPADWGIGVVRPFPTRVEQLDADVDTPAGVLAAARRFSALCAAGAEPQAPAFSQLMQAADQLGLFDAPDVLTAARWQQWLHPRGLDGRFIEVNSYVDVFGKSGGEGMLKDRKADRRRAKITGLFPQGAEVSYFGPDGKPIKADPQNGYPSLIPQGEIGQRVSSAPNARARLPGGLSSKAEFQQGLREAMTQDEYDQAVQEFNTTVVPELHPERSAAVRGAGKVTDDEYAAHSAYVADVTDAGLAKKLGSQTAMKDSYGRWGQDHLERMLAMADQLYQQVTAGKPQDRKVLFVGGLPGSGKSTLLGDLSDQGSFHKDDWVTINPDVVKDALIQADWYPKIDGLAPNETAGFIHAQSSEMAHMMERMAMKDGYNLIYDTTMGGRGTWLDEASNNLTAYGYSAPDGIFIDSAPDHSIASIAYRHRTGLDKYRTGKSGDRRRGADDLEVTAGGRYVPESVVTASLDEAGASTNRANFERMKKRFGNWAVYSVANAPGEKPQPDEIEKSSPDFLGSEAAA